MAHPEIVWTKDIRVADAPIEADEHINTGCGQGIEFIHSIVAGDRIAIVANALVCVMMLS
jgi:hypothetical protein